MGDIQATTIGPLYDNPDAVANPYEKLQNTVLRSYGLSAHQRTIKWLDHPGLGSNKPWVLMDQLTALKPTSVDKTPKVLFLRKIPTYIQDIVNPQDFQDLLALTEQCNKIWENWSQEPGPLSLPRLSRGRTLLLAVAAAAPPPSAESDTPPPSQANPALPHAACTGATMPTAGVSTTPTLDPGPRSARTA